MTGRIGVAISTTGDEHRLGFLETCVDHWDRALPYGGSLFVTVDGDEDAARRVLATVEKYTLSVFRVGQPPLFPSLETGYGTRALREGRLGVATNKNTGLELLMDSTRAEHLFLSDDDCWPLMPQAITKHTGLNWQHSMVCWGAGRLLKVRDKAVQPYAEWKWPRGVLLYTHRTVVETVGGMDERFGPGGHEHAEWSRRIHQAGFTPAPFITPASYAEYGVGGQATRAGALWNCEDMPRKGESVVDHRNRKRGQTSIRRVGSDWPHIEKVMAERDGDTSFVPFRAHDNGRLSATLCSDPMGRGAEGIEQPGAEEQASE